MKIDSRVSKLNTVSVTQEVVIFVLFKNKRVT